MKDFLDNNLFEADDFSLDIDELNKEEDSSTQTPTSLAEPKEDELVEEPDLVSTIVSEAVPYLAEFGMSLAAMWLGKKMLGGVLKKSFNTAVGQKATEAIAENGLKSTARTGILRNFLSKRGVAGASALSSGAMVVELIPLAWAGTRALFTLAGPALMNPWTGGAIVVSVAVTWGWFFLKGDKNKKEILELWPRGVYNPILQTTSPFNQEIVKYIGAAIGAGKKAVDYNPGVIKKKHGQIETMKCVKIMPTPSRLETEETNQKMAIFVRDFREVYSSSSLLNYLSYGAGTWKDYVQKLNESYSNLNISSHPDIDQYDPIRKYVTDNKLQDDDNRYGVALAEEADGWLSTGFKTFVPGMLPLGWADWLYSKKFIANTNGYLTITEDRKILFYTMQMLWKIKDINTNGFDVSIDEFCSIVNFMFDGKTGPWSDADFLRNLEFGVVDEKGKWKKKNNFQSLLNESITEHLAIMKKMFLSQTDGKRFPLTDASIAMSLYFLFVNILQQLEYNFVLHFAFIKQMTDVKPQELLEVAKKSGDAGLIEKITNWISQKTDSVNKVLKDNNEPVGVEAQKPEPPQDQQARDTIQRVKELIKNSGQKYKG